MDRREIDRASFEHRIRNAEDKAIKAIKDHDHKSAVCHCIEAVALMRAMQEAEYQQEVMRND